MEARARWCQDPLQCLRATLCQAGAETAVRAEVHPSETVPRGLKEETPGREIARSRNPGRVAAFSLETLVIVIIRLRHPQYRHLCTYLHIPRSRRYWSVSSVFDTHHIYGVFTCCNTGINLLHELLQNLWTWSSVKFRSTRRSGRAKRPAPGMETDGVLYAFERTGRRRHGPFATPQPIVLSVTRLTLVSRFTPMSDEQSRVRWP